jgi:hypothetical protein
MPNKAAARVDVNVNFNELNDYGQWVILPGAGAVWRPDADPGWRPFEYGHWVYSSDGWVWDSDEPFGWIVCHYGSWLNDRDQGWVWIPGYDWSPARVKWYVTDDEIGWAPLTTVLRRGNHQSSSRVEWSFAPVQFFTAPELRTHVTIRTNPMRTGMRVNRYNGPPRREFVQRIGQAPIVDVRVNKVRMTSREKPLIRAEVEHNNPRHVEVPVGPNYRRPPERIQPVGQSNSSDERNRVDRRRQGRNSNVQDNNGQEDKKVKVQVRTR